MEHLTRCFIAFDLPRAILNELEHLQKMVQQKNFFYGNYPATAQLHLTLKFLGEIDGKKIEETKKRLNTIRLAPFTVSLGPLGLFSPQSPYILWIQTLGAEQLQKIIDDILSDLFVPEHRFMGHITLARIKQLVRKKALLQFIPTLVLSQSFIIDRFYLKKSELLSNGPLYENLEEYLLHYSLFKSSRI